MTAAKTTGEITEFVQAQPLFGAHAHIMPVPDWAKTKPHFSSIAGYALADLASAAGPLPVGQETFLPATTDDPAYAKRYFELWRASHFTGYTRPIELASRDLLGVEYIEKNAEEIGEAIGKLVGASPRASYCEILQKRANIRWLIKDNIHKPEQAADELYPPEFVRLNYRDDDLLCIRSRTDVARREGRWGRSLHSLADLVAGFNDSITACLATNKVTSFKLGVAYQRGLAFTEPTLHEAERAFTRLMRVTPGETIDPAPPFVAGSVRVQSRLSARKLRPLQDYLTHQYLRRIEAECLPLQVHTGYLAGVRGVLNNIRAMEMVPVFIRYPRVRFDLFHAGWPYVEEHAVLGKEFPNVWLNMCWMWAMNPVTAARALESWLACVPHTKIFAYGGDTNSPICEYAYAQQARAGIARVLERIARRGGMTAAGAKEVAADIMLHNGCRFHGLEA